MRGAFSSKLQNQSLRGRGHKRIDAAPSLRPAIRPHRHIVGCFDPRGTFQRQPTTRPIRDDSDSPHPTPFQRGTDQTLQMRVSASTPFPSRGFITLVLPRYKRLPSPVLENCSDPIAPGMPDISGYWEVSYNDSIL